MLFSKLQTCYTASGMDDLDPSVAPDTMPSVEQRSDILQVRLAALGTETLSAADRKTCEGTSVTLVVLIQCVVIK